MVDGHNRPVTSDADPAAILSGLATPVKPVDRAAEQRARQRLDELLVPTGSLGDLHPLAVWWCGVRRACPPGSPASVHAVVLAADHGIGVRGVSALPLGHTAVAARAVREHASATDAAADVAGARVRLVDVDVAGPDGPRSMPFDEADALTRDQVRDAVAEGAALADEEADGGADLLVLGELGVGGSTVAAAVVGAAQRRSVLEVLGRGSGVDDLAWMRKAVTVREGLRRARTRPRDTASILQVVGSLDVAVGVGLLLRAAARGVPVLLDGPVTAAAGVLAHRVSPTARQWWLFPDRSTEPALHLAQDALGMRPAQDLGVACGGGVPGLLTVPLLGVVATLLDSVRTWDEAWPGSVPDVGRDEGRADDLAAKDPAADVERDGVPGADTGS